MISLTFRCRCRILGRQREGQVLPFAAVLPSGGGPYFVSLLLLACAAPSNSQIPETVFVERGDFRAEPAGFAEHAGSGRQ
jgi:hypothetical protein